VERATYPTGVAVITGAAGGIGAATARHMAAEGWPLLLCDSNEPRLHALAADLQSEDRTVDLLPGDISEPIFPHRLAAALDGRAVGAFVHLVGITPMMGDARRILHVNLDTTLALLDLVRPRMAENGAVILMSTTAAHSPTITLEEDAIIDSITSATGSSPLVPLQPSPQRAYMYSKRAMLSLARRQADAFGKNKARILSISPGFIETETFCREREQATFVYDMIAKAPLPRFGQSDDVAGVTAFLCSNHASYMTGCDIKIDGGLAAG
jgi:NAD(P)-dependent dehydrogenase (short-subunit alcohol dehydrogenase family)